ncbi:MAG: response regulator [Deltaproteobacteria bacterium]|nr:response regulator [Deltaproteobacteria bacterium]
MVKKKGIVVGSDNDHIKNLCSILEKVFYQPIVVPSLSEAEALLAKHHYWVLVIDLDQIVLDNRFLKELRKEYQTLAVIGLSSRRFHQELEEAMSRYIDACFKKSEEYEDLLYWLKAVVNPYSPSGKAGKGRK